jgi:ComF family protein
MLKLWRYALELIYPLRCPGCGKQVSRQQRWCSQCVRSVWNPRLLRHSRMAHLNGCYTLCNYEGPMRRALVGLKFHRKKSYAPSFPELLYHFPWWDGLTDFTAAVPIPLSEKRYRERGYNQTDLIFESFFKSQGRTYLPHGLVRIRHTPSQSSLPRAVRVKNLHHAFHVNHHVSLEGKKVLLCDDIYTTGSTMEAAAAELLRAGAREVRGITLASGAS